MQRLSIQPRHRRPARSRPRGLRNRRIVRVRAAIRAGTYENPLKLEIAADRLLDVLAR